MPDWLVVVASYAALLAIAAGAAWVLNQIIEIWDLLRRRRLFTEDLKTSLEVGSPTWEQVVDFADLRGLSRGQTTLVIRILVRDVLTDKAKALKEKLPLLEAYLTSHQESEPFEGMPNEIRIHLERLKELGTSAERILEPLTSQIRDLLALKSKEYSRQKLYTVGGFILGVVGLLFAGYTYMVPSPMGSGSSTESSVTSGTIK